MKEPKLLVFREWTTDEHEVRIRHGQAVPVVVNRSWVERAVFEPNEFTQAENFYRVSLRGDWVPAAATSWGVSSPDAELEEIFHGRPVPMPEYIREKLAALQARIRMPDEKPWSH